MRKLFLTIAMISCYLLAIAQKTDTICDRLYSVKKINNSFYLLNLGGYYPNQKHTVVLKGYQDVKKLVALKDSQICLAGKLQNYKGQMQLVVSGTFRNIRKH